ncbi:MAG: ABC transporter ATP-binding protein [Clostridia bacterium]|nr:ABC transporter ATP-binding protein [Clostridia bacterium]
MIKKLSRSIRDQKWNSILAMVTITGEVIMEVIIPLIMANMIDYGIDAGNMGTILKTGVFLIFAALGQLVFGVISGRYAAVASSGFARNLRHDMFHKVQTFSFSNIDKFSTASIVTRLTSDVMHLQHTYQMIIRMAVRSPLMAIFALCASMTIDVKLSLIFLAVVPILLAGLWLIMTKTHPIFERVFKKMDRLNGVVQENLHGVRVVKSFVREDHEEKKFTTASGDIAQDFIKAERQLAWNGPLMQMCMYTTVILLSWFGARAIVACGGDAVLGLSTGELLSLISYSTQILGSLMGLSMMFVMLTMSRAAGKRIVEILDEESDITAPANARMEVADGSIDFENVMFSYHRKSDKPVLDNINLHIPSGATVGIIGGTGSSKSSIVQLIPRLYDVQQGAVKVGGADVREYDLDALRNEVAMVLQKNVLFSGTIKDNLRWGNENATDEEMIHACKLAQADDFISAFPEGYDTYIEQGGTNVSGGQKQRLCIARALLKKPKILILDDSTSAVDTRTDALIREAFATEIPNTTKIIIAQRIASVQSADMILVLDDGKVTACGTHDELIRTSDIYREVYESQTKGDA